jgi:hypothetical protein
MAGSVNERLILQKYYGQKALFDPNAGNASLQGKSIIAS